MGTSNSKDGINKKTWTEIKDNFKNHIPSLVDWIIDNDKSIIMSEIYNKIEPLLEDFDYCSDFSSIFVINVAIFLRSIRDLPVENRRVLITRYLEQMIITLIEEYNTGFHDSPKECVNYKLYSDVTIE